MKIISIPYWIVVYFRDFFPGSIKKIWLGAISVVEHKSGYIIFNKFVKREYFLLFKKGGCIIYLSIYLGSCDHCCSQAEVLQ